MKFDILEIIEGLEDAFFSIFQLGNNADPSVLQSRIPPASRTKATVLYDKSLFVLWQSLYDGFDSSRRASWDVYWGTLPFGTHSGGNGWPGSGYSAFVYWNAPRYKSGLDLDYDPPSGDLISNGDFAGSAIGWGFGDYAFYSDNQVTIFNFDNSFGELAFRQLIDAITDGVTYRLEYDILSLSDSGDSSRNLAAYVGDAGFVEEPCFIGHHILYITASLSIPMTGGVFFLWDGTLGDVVIDNISMFVN